MSLALYFSRVRSNEVLDRICDSPQSNHFTFRHSLGTLNHIATGADANAITVVWEAVCYEYEHVCDTSHWDLALRKNFALGRKEFRPDHADAIFERIVTFIEKVEADVLPRRILASAFAMRQEPIPNPKRRFLSSILAIRMHAI